ncbi:hypothetical protein H0R92_07910 [Treponema sp. OMZ 840]|uniref:hypothetical protein n=1 Tax=Treponema sp. OMZ 840 TaxID=244313 RepID=UPI003D9448FC
MFCEVKLVVQTDGAICAARLHDVQNFLRVIHASTVIKSANKKLYRHTNEHK